jgi:DNA-binding response OmpR family regulator
MDFRKIESGSLQLEPVQGDLVVFAQNVFDAFAHLAAERQMTYQFFSSKDKIWASFDTDKLEKILNNLLSNALKYTPEGGEVTLEITTEETHKGAPMQSEPVAMIRVKDSGIGIPAEDVPHIFDPFYQARQTNPYKQASSGIGLALTRELVKLHRGNITLQSQPGDGTTVTVELPLMQADAHAMQKVVFSATENTHTDEILAETPFEEKHSSEKKAQPLLLVVDDNPDIRQFILENFSDQYRIREAENGKIALKEAIHHVPDMVISDVLMPVMDGITFCKKLRANEQTSHVPVILLTASHSETNRLRALSIGADDYIHKPFNIFLLKVRVQNLLEMRQQLRTRFSREVRLQPKDVTVSDVDEKFLQRLMDVVEASIGDSDFNVNVLCKKTGISRPQLYRKLQALTGQSVHEFIRTVRLKRAAQLLETGQLSIAEVAYRVGFNDPHYFSRCFKKQFGVSPSKVSA